MSSKVIAGTYQGSLITGNGVAAYFRQSKNPLLTPEYIEEYELVDTERKKSAGSAIIRGGVGSFFLGPVGLLAGVSAKTKGTHTIAIQWKDGNKSLIELDEKAYKTFLKANF